MRSGFKGSTARLIVLLGLVLVALALVAVPLAIAAAPGTGPVVAASMSYGSFSAAPRSPVQIRRRRRRHTYAHGHQDGRSGHSWPSSVCRFRCTPTRLTATGTAANFADTTAPVSVVYYPPETVGAANVALSVAVKNTTVSGTVKSAKTKKAVKGVKVTLGNQTATTSKKGKYSIVVGLWPATSYKVTFAWKGHKKVTKTITSAPGSVVGLNVSLK